MEPDINTLHNIAFQASGVILTCFLICVLLILQQQKGIEEQEQRGQAEWNGTLKNVTLLMKAKNK